MGNQNLVLQVQFWQINYYKNVINGSYSIFQPVTIDYQKVLSTVNTNLDFLKEHPKNKTQPLQTPHIAWISHWESKKPSTQPQQIQVSQVVDFPLVMRDFRSHKFHVLRRFHNGYVLSATGHLDDHAIGDYIPHL